MVKVYKSIIREILIYFADGSWALREQMLRSEMALSRAHRPETPLQRRPLHSVTVDATPFIWLRWATISLTKISMFIERLWNTYLTDKCTLSSTFHDIPYKDLYLLRISQRSWGTSQIQAACFSITGSDIGWHMAWMDKQTPACSQGKVVVLHYRIHKAIFECLAWLLLHHSKGL